MADVRDDAQTPARDDALERRIAILEEALREKQREVEVLRTSRERLLLSVAGADIGTWDWDVRTGRVSYDERWFRMLGYEPGELEPGVGTWESRVHPDDLPRVRAALADHLDGRTDAYETEHRLRHKSGSWVWVLDRGRVIERDAGGTPLRVSGTHLDVTERKTAEEKLRHLHNLMRYIIEHSRSAIAVHDRDLRYIWVSQRYLDEYGVKEKDVIGRHHYEVFPDLPQKWCDVHQRALAGEVSSAEDDPYERDDGSVDWTRWECRPWYEADGSIGGLIVYTEVVTERKRAEIERQKLMEQLLQAQKMESVGRLAGGVAHDYNNMLSVILGHAELALEKTIPGRPVHVHLEEIQKAASRSADLTRQLLAFSRQQAASPKCVQLNDVVSDALSMLERLIGEDIELRWIPGGDLWTVRVDPRQIEQILANLCVNARDAIEGVGCVTIETRNAGVVGGPSGSARGEYVSLVVSDDGCGMSEETLAHIFEPFYTTKPTGQGTGLGLATTYGIVKQNGGSIDVRSESGRGTTIAIHLPRYAGAAEPPRKGGPAGAAAGGRETVLLVEDEPALLNLEREMLESFGYRVLAARSPSDAMRLADRHAGCVDLLITDVIMPGMNGRELAERLSVRHSKLKRLFTSGYTANVIAHRGVLDEGVHFIAKPFSLEGLAAKVREVLDGA